MCEGIQSEVISITRFEENSDLSITYVTHMEIQEFQVNSGDFGVL